MKFTDEQNELLAFLPKALKNSKELTDSSKLVLGNIIFLYGMEDVQKNGYVFRSYDDLMKDTFIKSKTSISRAIALLVQKEYIKVKSGRLKERKANEFTLLNGTLLNKMCTEKCTDKNEKCTEKCTLIDYWTNKIESLENEIVLLKKEIEELKKCTEKCTDENEKCTEKCTTDTETDTEIEKDIYNNTCSNSTCMEEENIKEKSNKKEMDYKDNGSMGVSPSDERDESFWEFYNSLEDGDDWDESQMEEVNKNIKENEMNDNGMNGMNANGNGVKRNETITSTYGDKKENTVQIDKVLNNGSIFKENCSKPLSPQIPLTPLSPKEHNLKLEEAIFGGAGASETSSMDNLSTNDNTMQPEAQECPQIEFDNERMEELFSLSERETNFESFKDYVKQMDEYMQYLKANDTNLFKLYKKEIYCWFARNTWDMNFDFIEVGGDFKRKYVA